MELKPNMYVRTKEGYICKILKLNETFEDDGYLDHNDIGSASIQEKNVIKTSHNIIDLIEVGDYVNGYRVEEIFNHGFKNDKVIIEIPFNLRIDSDDYIKTFIHVKDIKSILTHEQFEANAYTIEKER